MSPKMAGIVAAFRPPSIDPPRPHLDGTRWTRRHGFSSAGSSEIARSRYCMRFLGSTFAFAQRKLWSRMAPATIAVLIVSGPILTVDLQQSGSDSTRWQKWTPAGPVLQRFTTVCSVVRLKVVPPRPGCPEGSAKILRRSSPRQLRVVCHSRNVRRQICQEQTFKKMRAVCWIAHS